MRTAAETRDNKYGVGTDTGGKCGRIGRENVDGVPLGSMATAASMDLTPYLTEERPTKKRPAQHIGRGLAEAAAVF